MFASLLVANRGEIACRIFRTARAMGLRCIAVYSEADAKAKHVREADAAVHIGASPAAESYLRGDKIIAAAKAEGADAIHPGYGFLSENPDFAQAVIDAGLIWVGPKPSSIRAMGLKDEAKRIAIAAGVPVLPGYQGEDQSEKTLLKAAKEIGFPVLIKAVAGGGGRGIREVRAAEEFKAQLESAQREAQAAFGDARVLVEKLVERPRHIEVQVFGDAHGGLVHLYERDCSLQRRRQKVIEEAPAPGMTEEVRAAMCEAALKVARAVDYENAGTVEFIVDGNGPLSADGFWFMEMNTRLQVEHPVTEAVTGVDLVAWQLRVAAGEALPLAQDEITLTGHAIEARICAEDPSEEFRPSVGRIEALRVPHRSSIDLHAGFDVGDVVSPNYDSLIAKAICHAPSGRNGALSVLRGSLAGSVIDGLETNCAFLVKVLALPAFVAGAPHVGLIADEMDALGDMTGLRDLAAAVARVALERDDPHLWSFPSWEMNDGFRLNARPQTSLRLADAADSLLEASLVRLERRRAVVDVNSARIEFDVDWISEGSVGVQLPGPMLSTNAIDVSRTSEGLRLFVFGRGFTFLEPGASREHADGAAADEIKAPLPGKIVAVSAKEGAAVKKGEALVTLEAMKMEHQLKAPRDGIIARVAAAPGAQVKEGAILIALETEA
ncbi:MAG: biotin/lipoyl-binding protein [Alphaproteobacteria bacterium]|nr:biotin/lipoyl-binding protein [Alphaproteobacteria bacterium]